MRFDSQDMRVSIEREEDIVESNRACCFFAEAGILVQPLAWLTLPPDNDTRMRRNRCTAFRQGVDIFFLSFSSTSVRAFVGQYLAQLPQVGILSASMKLSRILRQFIAATSCFSWRVSVDW
jgi:hypothetical protein